MQGQCYVNKEQSKFENANPAVIENNYKKLVRYFISGPQQEADKKASKNSQRSYKRNLKMCLKELVTTMANFYYRLTQTVNHIRCHCYV